VKRMVTAAMIVVIGAFAFGFGTAAGAVDYPPKVDVSIAARPTTGITVAAPADASVDGQSASPPTDATLAAVQGAPLPFTGSDSAQLLWVAAALLVGGAALAGARRTFRR
jgi:hypothetical protein